MALPKQYRLSQSKQFARVYRVGKHAKAKCLAVKAMCLPVNGAEGPSRFGITVSQKVSKRAVTRNRIKRQVSAAIHSLSPRLRPGHWVVIIVRSAASECDYWQFLQELEKLFSELEVLDGYSGGSLL